MLCPPPEVAHIVSAGRRFVLYGAVSSLYLVIPEAAARGRCIGCRTSLLPAEAAAPRCFWAVAAAMGETETGEVAVERAEPVPGFPAEEPVLWSPEVEVCLFHAMLGHKPVGVNRHFHMICIRDKFSQNIGRQISSKVIWEHLRTMYDMQALHESEILPFPNSEKNFILPEEIIQEVKEGKVNTEEDTKDEMKEDVDVHSVSDEAFTNSSVTSGKSLDKPSGKEKERTLSESGSKESGDKRKRSRLTEKVVNANSNPSSPNASKRRRT